MTVHQLACKWLLQANPALTAITGTFLNEKEIREACDAMRKPNLTREELRKLSDGYQQRLRPGAGAHPCDLKSSIDPSGRGPERLRPAAGADRVMTPTALVCSMLCSSARRASTERSLRPDVGGGHTDPLLTLRV